MEIPIGFFKRWNPKLKVDKIYPLPDKSNADSTCYYATINTEKKPSSAPQKVFQNYMYINSMMTRGNVPPVLATIARNTTLRLLTSMNFISQNHTVISFVMPLLCLMANTIIPRSLHALVKR